MPGTAMPIPCAGSDRSQIEPGKKSEAEVPIRIPGDSTPYDPFVWQETPENEEDEEQIR